MSNRVTAAYAIKMFLRAAALVAFVQFAAHTYLLLTYVPTRGAEETRVVETMRAYRFDFGGSRPTSYWEMYIGYGLFAAVNCLVEGLLFWFASRFTETASLLVRRLAALFVVANLTYAALVWRYFFFIPLVMDLLIAACLTAALLAGRHSPRPVSESAPLRA